ncbi:hypothetical protein Cgig2_005962 [Carnegiea gigantea]|uniref:RNase H type-1 domain-containing protein n=1 Tax=Carnegiea gigantea TaxID=171969 RepID=A0A9Q1KIY7_9CARY|nr:hypothetical protein Cgig2_005962 [Carnegiea gigantea]
MVEGALKYVFDYKCYLNKIYERHINHRKCKNKWEKPTEDFVKVNVDAALIYDGCVGLGVVCRNEEGKIVTMAVKRLKVNWKSKLADLRLGYTRLVLESDSLLLISSLDRSGDDITMEQLVTDDILHLSSFFENFRYLHVKRVGNCVAHFVAKLNPSTVDEHVWVDNFSQGVVALADSDLIN